MTVRLDVDSVPHVAIATLDRPSKRNAVNVEITQQLTAIVERVETDPDIRVAILTAATVGDRPVFCAGADLADVAAGQGHLLATELGGLAGFAYCARTKPWIAAVDGAAVGGGFELVLACDLVVATRRSSFGLPEVRRGLLAGAGGVQRLPRLLPPALALTAILTGESIPAERLADCGFLAALVDPSDVLSAALDLAERIAACAPVAVREARAIAVQALLGAQPVYREMADVASARVAASQDATEGVAAFLEKRSPVWTGR